MESGWLQVASAASQPVASWLAVSLLAVTALGALAIVVSVRASRRIAAAVAATAWMAAAMSSWTVIGSAVAFIVPWALAVALTVFWLVDRGIPGNRRRPAWFKVFGFGLLLLAVACLILIVPLLRPS